MKFLSRQLGSKGQPVEAEAPKAAAPAVEAPKAVDFAQAEEFKVIIIYPNINSNKSFVLEFKSTHSEKLGRSYEFRFDNIYHLENCLLSETNVDSSKTEWNTSKQYFEN